MDGVSNKENEDVTPLHPSGDKNYGVRVTAHPDDPRSIEIVENLLSRCELSLCESSTEVGVSIWLIIVPEDLVDEALRGIAVVVPVDYEFFKTMEGKIFVVTATEVYQLSGYGEETALCWEGEDLIEFDFAVSRIIGDQMSIELQELIDENPKEDEDLLAEVQDRAWAKANIYRWGEEDVREAVRESFQELLDEKGPKKGGE